MRFIKEDVKFFVSFQTGKYVKCCEVYGTSRIENLSSNSENNTLVFLG